MYDSKLKATLERLLGNPDYYPDKLKSWVSQQVASDLGFRLNIGQLPQGEAVRYVGTSPAFQNLWVNYDATHQQAGFWKDPWGVVHLQGLVKTGTVPANIFTLPAGYRPALESNHVIAANDAFGRVAVKADGSVYMAIGSNVWTSLDGISFRAGG
jgi:hypothetical protein